MESYNSGMSTFICKCHWCGKELVRNKQSIHVEFHFCNNNCKSEYQRTLKPVTKDWLYEHYIIKGLNTTEIARMVGRDPKSVWNWLKDFGIPTRPRGGHTLPHAFKKGDKNLFEGRKHSEETRRKLSEIAKATGRLPYKRENGPPWKGKGGEGHPSWKGGITAERNAFYASEEWRQAANSVKKRDKETCQRCGKVKGLGEGYKFDIHHIVGFECVRLRADVNNLVYLCKPCHYWVHGKENVNHDFIKEPSE
jgi:ssDNA-binding Zn-finger/Zn-ribbon topoisomerase 1